MTKDEIKSVLPHREPMLLVDDIVKNDDGTVTGFYTVRGDEFFLQGHFPGMPVVPGVILCEWRRSLPVCLWRKVTLYAGMNNVKFKNPVKPGDTAEFTCVHVRSMGPVHFIRAEGRVNGKLCVSGDFSFALLDKK